MALQIASSLLALDGRPQYQVIQLDTAALGLHQLLLGQVLVFVFGVRAFMGQAVLLPDPF